MSSDPKKHKEDIDTLRDIVKFLMEYPAIEEPPPPGFPPELCEPIYPGKDYVIGMCDEAIEQITKDFPTAPKANRPVMQSAIDMWNAMKEYRYRKLASANAPPQYNRTFTEQVMDNLL
jgi:hypothetical protein